MIFNCVICSDIFDSASETYITPCGHLFHYVCLIEWLERSKSCPQCRNRTTESNIHRVFFNIQNDGKEDAGSLRNQIENLKFSVQMKELEVKNATDEVNTLKKRNVKLRGEFKTFEEKITTLERLNESLQAHVKFLKNQMKDGEDAKEAACELRKKLEVLQNVELAVRGTVPEVEAMLNSHSGTSESQRAMCTYAAVLKRELNVANKRKREMDTKISSLQKALVTAEGERERKRAVCASKELMVRQLEDDVRHLEEEKKSLSRKVKDLEQAIVSPSADPRNSALHRLVAESPAPDSVKKFVKRPKLTDPSEDCKENTMEVSATPVARKLPYLSGGSSIAGLPALPASRFVKMSRHTSFLHSVPRISAATREETYDGMGGHSRCDDFPVPIARIRAIPIGRTRLKVRNAPLGKRVSPLTTLDAFVDLT